MMYPCRAAAWLVWASAAVRLCTRLSQICQLCRTTFHRIFWWLHSVLVIRTPSPEQSNSPPASPTQCRAISGQCFRAELVARRLDDPYSGFPDSSAMPGEPMQFVNLQILLADWMILFPDPPVMQGEPMQFKNLHVLSWHATWPGGIYSVSAPSDLTRILGGRNLISIIFI